MLHRGFLLPICLLLPSLSSALSFSSTSCEDVLDATILECMKSEGGGRREREEGGENRPKFGLHRRD